MTLITLEPLVVFTAVYSYYLVKLQATLLTQVDCIKFKNYCEATCTLSHYIAIKGGLTAGGNPMAD